MLVEKKAHIIVMLSPLENIEGYEVSNDKDRYWPDGERGITKELGNGIRLELMKIETEGNTTKRYFMIKLNFNHLHYA